MTKDASAESSGGSQPAVSRRAVVGGGLVALGLTALATRQTIKDWVFGGENGGLDSLEGKPRNPDALKNPYFRPHEVKFEKGARFRKHPDLSDSSIISEEELKRNGIDAEKPFHTIDIYGVPYKTPGHLDSLGRYHVIDPKTGKDTGIYGLWQQVVATKPDGTIDHRFNIFVADLNIKEVTTSSSEV